MSKRISPAFAVTEGKVHIALPENCPYNTVAWCYLAFALVVRTVGDDELPVPQGKTLITFLRTR